MAKYLMLNSEIKLASKPCLNATNRGLLYGDSFTYFLRGNSSKAFFLEDTFKYMLDCMRTLEMEVPELLKLSIFATDLELLLQKNRIYKGFSACITVFRNDSNTRVATNNTVSILIVVKAEETEKYSLNDVGLKVGVSKTFKLPDHIIENSILPIFNNTLLGIKEVSDYQVDDYIFTDSKGSLISTSDSLLLFAIDNKLVIPSKVLENSNRFFLNIVIALAKELKIQITRTDIRQEDLLVVDEVFIVNPVNGINWVLTYKEKRYYHKISSLLVKELNRRLH